MPRKLTPYFLSQSDIDDIARIDSDLAHVPPAAWAEDPVSQAEAYRAAIANDETRRDIDFHSKSFHNVLLSRLKAIDERADPHEALMLLKSRHKLKIDSEYKISGDDRNIHWDTSKGALDFICCVPAHPGFTAMLPRSNQHPNFEWQMDFNRPQKQFKSKHARLDFDPASSMAYLGMCRNLEIWGALIPVQFFDDPDAWKRPGPGYSSGTSTMPSIKYFRMLMFLTYMMDKLGIHEVAHPDSASTRYPMALGSFEEFRAVSNLM